MCIYTCIHTHIHMYTHRHVYMHIDIYIYIYVEFTRPPSLGHLFKVCRQFNIMYQLVYVIIVCGFLLVSLFINV